jgi:hypothetical protein
LFWVEKIYRSVEYFMKIWFENFTIGMVIVLIAGCHPASNSHAAVIPQNDASKVIVSEVTQPNEKIESKRFQEIPASAVPESLIKIIGESCQGLAPPECRKHFLENGAGWLGDLNDDGQPEYVLRATDFGGTGGEPYFIFQKSNDAWVPLANNLGPQGFIGFIGIIGIIGIPRFEILQTIRDGFHDFRIGVTTFCKWNGKSYVFYEQKDWEQLKPESIHVETIHDLDLLWKVRYSGKTQFRLEPDWFNGEPYWGSNVELEDTELGLKWVATFKGGVYAIQKGKSFLLMPRPEYGGARKLELNGEWLLIYAGVFIDKEKKKMDVLAVAKYNRKSGELIIEHDLE